MSKKIFVTTTKENLPFVRDRHPFIYLEHGRLEIDDGSVKWSDACGNVIPLPAATINCLLLGPGSTVTHDAVKICAAANCSICWVGEDSFLFYASGISPTNHTKNIKKQIKKHSDLGLSLGVAKKMFLKRYPDMQTDGKNIKEMMGAEGHRVRSLYERKAGEYGVGWSGRKYIPGNFEMSDTTNKILSASCQALYGIVTSCITSLGYSPYIGFIHSGSPLPFTYDITDLYKEELCVDLAFSATKELGGDFDRMVVRNMFRERVVKIDLLKRIPKDIEDVLA